MMSQLQTVTIDPLSSHSTFPIRETNPLKDESMLGIASLPF
jgi:hypothetical protein